ncbi:MAG: 3'-5' exonuclease [Ectothiorhodospiraceae bacterium]|nr:3'-5' exonuclease [Ectothiorhodospiraceae bacterium]
MQTRLVFDIETAGYDFDSLDDQMKEYLLKFAETDEEIEAEKLKINMYAYTAQTVCIGMLNVDTMKGQVLVQAPEGADRWVSDDGNVEYIPGTEEDVLRGFWKVVAQYEQIISYNGRGFDGPFLHLRSAMKNIKPTRNLVPYRYDASRHCDLLDQMSFYGSYRRFSLDFVCTSMGIESPKRQGVTGMDVWELFREGNYKDIAEYNYRDLIATRELFLRWDNFINIG